MQRLSQHRTALADSDTPEKPYEIFFRVREPETFLRNRRMVGFLSPGRNVAVGFETLRDKAGIM